MTMTAKQERSYHAVMLMENPIFRELLEWIDNLAEVMADEALEKTGDDREFGFCKAAAYKELKRKLKTKVRNTM
jgi:hypothetical protein